VAGWWQGNGRGIVWERHGMCESAFNTLGERHGMCESALTAWELHGMCELASTVHRRHVGDLPAFGFFPLPCGVTGSL
jgi:hypothetical protein